jgi:Putative peptidoglycan binding domain
MRPRRGQPKLSLLRVKHFGVEMDESLRRRGLFEEVARLRSDVALLGSAAGGKARLLVQSIIEIARGVYIGVIASALVLGIGGNALLSQIRRHPAPPFEPAYQEASSTPPKIASATTSATEAVTPASSAPVLSSNPISTVAPAVVDVSRVSSISAAAPLPEAIGRGESRPNPRTPDQIGGLLSGKPLHDESHLIRAAQTALAKLGYAVKIDGVEDGYTRRALRDFERAHGLAITPEISSALVSQLSAAARVGRHKASD